MLHINADVDCGTIYVKVTDSNGTALLKKIEMQLFLWDQQL